MQTFLSGLSEQACCACAGTPLSQVASLIWQPASLFIAEAEMAVDDPACQWVWLYRAPWVWLSEDTGTDPAIALQQWQTQQRAALQLRRYLGQKLILVNADRVTPQALAARLGLEADASITQAAGTPLAMALAGLCEQLAPECWDLYETLEAAAWLSEGEPEFRSNRTPAGEEALHVLLGLVQAGNRLPAMQAALNEREQTVHKLGEELQSVVTRSEASHRHAIEQLDERERRIDDLVTQLRQMQSDQQAQTEEYELLLTQLRQAQEVSEKHSLESLSLKEQLLGLQQRLEQAQAQQQKLQQERDAARKAADQSESASNQQKEQNSQLQEQLDKIRSELNSASGESELLLSQLHQVQEELEKYFLENLAYKEQLIALQKQLEQAKVEQQKLQQERDTARKAADQGEAVLRQRIEELAQLQKRQAETAKQLEQTQAQQQKLQQERDTARKAADQSEAACRQQGEQHSLLQQQLNKLRLELDSANEEGELLLSQLHQVQEELENYYLANRELLSFLGDSDNTLQRARRALVKLAAHV